MYGIELVVAPLADVVAELQRSLMLLEELVVGTDHLGVLDEVSHHFFLAQDGVVFVREGVLAAIDIVLGLGHSLTIGEESLEGRPRLAVEEVLLAGGVDDDVELG